MTPKKTRIGSNGADENEEVGKEDIRSAREKNLDFCVFQLFPKSYYFSIVWWVPVGHVPYDHLSGRADRPNTEYTEKA